MTCTHSVPKEDVVTTEPDEREPKHISEYLTEAVKEMSEANLVQGGTFTTTTYDHLIPCPPWCTYPSGHPYELVEEDGVQVRYHSPNDGGLRNLGPFWLSSEEIMHPRAVGPRVELHELMVCVEPGLIGQDGRMTITEARLTAKALTIAADMATAAIEAAS